MADPVSIGINIAIQFAIQLAIAALTPKQNTEGPRLEDRSITVSTYGKSRIIGYGTVTLTGNVIWGREIEEVATKEDIGKGNPFSLGTSTTYTYFATFAVALANREIASILKIYADGKLIYDVEDINFDPDPFNYNQPVDNSLPDADDFDGVLQYALSVLTFKEKDEELNFRIYRGTETQMPDPIISEDYPEGEVPAYRGTAYIVFNRMPLADYGNRIPQFEFVTAFADSNGTPKAVIPADGTTGYPNLPGTVGFPNMTSFDELVFWYSSEPTPGDGDLFLFDLATGQLIRSLLHADFVDQFENGGWRDILVNPNFVGQIRLIDGRIGGSNLACPYIVYGQGGTGSTPHYVLDKFTFKLKGASGRGFGRGGFTSTVTPDGKRTILVDSSGGGCVVSVNGENLVNHYWFGAFGGSPTASSNDGFSGPNQGIFGIYTLPDLYLIGDNITLGNNLGPFGGVHITREELGFTELIAFAGEVSTQAWEADNYQMVRITVDYNGLTNVEYLTIKGLGGEDRTGINPLDRGGSTAALVKAIYDPLRDIMVITAGRSSSGFGSDQTTFGFFLNSRGGRSDLDAGEVEELWRTDEGDHYFNSSDVTHDGGLSQRIDGEFFCATPTTWDLRDPETGQLIEQIPREDDYFDFLGNSIDGGAGTVGDADTAVWDINRRAAYQYGAAGGTGWLYIDPPLLRGSESLQTVVEDIVLRSKLTDADIDASDLNTKQVKGYTIADDMSFRAALEPLATVYNFYAVENAGILEFKFKDGVTDLVIPEDDILSSEDGIIQYEETRGQEPELPKALYAEYYEFGRTDRRMVQGAQRISTPEATVGSVGEVRYQFPMVLTDAEAQQACGRILYETWVGQEQIKLDLPQRYMDILPNDVLDVTAQGRRDNIRVTRVGVGQDLSVKVEGTIIDGSIYEEEFLPVNPKGSPGWGRIDQVRGARSTQIYGQIMDAPFPADIYAERDRTQGALYLTFSGTFRPGGAFKDTTFLVATNQIDYSQRSVNTNKIAWVQLDSVMPPPPSNNFNGIHNMTIDALTIDGTDEFTSTTDTDLLTRDVNAAVIYNPTTGIMEYVSFRDVETVSTTSGSSAIPTTKLRFSNFLRGKRGTDVMAGQHSDGAYMILLNTDDFRGFWEPNSLLTASVAYKVVNLDNLQQTAVTRGIVYQHKALMPLAPTHVEIADSGSDKELTWTRRTRLNGDSALPRGGEVPLSEDTEEYEIDILDGASGNVLRTLTSSTESVTYLLDDAIYDFDTVGFPSTLYVKVYQMSAQVGRGFGHEWALTT